MKVNTEITFHFTKQIQVESCKEVSIPQQLI
jgi:hypothetical protein